VNAGIERLKAEQPAFIALSPHDSNDEVIARFRSAFGTRHRDLRVGDPIIIRRQFRQIGGGPSTAITGNKPVCFQASGDIALALNHRESNKGLNADEKHAAGIECVFIVERNRTGSHNISSKIMLLGVVPA
jgi:hypothetical protein